MENKNITIDSEDKLFEIVSLLIEESRRQVAKAVNTAMVYTYYGVGQYIVEYEQGGKSRAAYGKGVLKRLSVRLTEKYGKGWSVDTLENARKLFKLYSISAPVVRKSSSKKTEPLARNSIIDTTADPIHKFVLPWSHYIILMREENPQARSFYEIEAYNQQWSKRQLQRQVGSSRYDRHVILPFEKPTIGILLCEQKNSAVVELTLPKDANIYAQQYALCLPKKELLQAKLREWVDEYNETNEQEE